MVTKRPRNPRNQAARKKSHVIRTDAGRAAAEEALLDQVVFVFDKRAYNALVGRMDAPPVPSGRLKRTMRSALPWRKA